MTDTSKKALDALDQKLASQIGDDVQVIYDHEALFKQSRAIITAMRTERDALVAAAYADAGFVAADRCAACGAREIAGLVKEHVTRRTPADARAALAASRAAPDCHQRDLVTAPQVLRITGPNSDGEYWLHINAGGRTGGINLGSEHGPICKRLLDSATEPAPQPVADATRAQEFVRQVDAALRIEVAALQAEFGPDVMQVAAGQLGRMREASTPQPVAVKVKPLVWKVSAGGAYVSGPYMVSERVDGKGWNASALFVCDDRDGHEANFHATILLAETFADCIEACDEAHRCIVTALSASPLAACTAQDAGRAPETDAERFDRADWYWRTMDPDDSADTPSEAIHRGMMGDFCVCEIASSYTGPVRYGFTAPVLDPESDDAEFLHFATQQEAIDAANERSAALRAIGGDA